MIEEEKEFKEAQKLTNFVVLMPFLPKAYVINNIFLRKESNTERSSLRFEMKNNGRKLRIKQFFYDWAIPVITADTNLASQGTAFNIDGIVGFIGRDYKGNQAACFTKWFTNVELSVLEGLFEEREIVQILKSLKAIDTNYIKKLGEQSFTTCSFTSRLKLPKWESDDEVTRVVWYESTEERPIKESKELGISLPTTYDNYFLDSIGYKNYSFGNEFHFLYRSQKNYTDGFWLWIAPKEISDPLPSKAGHGIGTRQSWNVRKVNGKHLNIPVKEVVLCRQNTSYHGWMIHWERDNYVYHLYVRPSANIDLRTIRGYLTELYSS